MTISFEQVKASLSMKSNEEIQAALARYDESEYTDQAFAAMRQILIERGEETPGSPSAFSGGGGDASGAHVAAVVVTTGNDVQGRVIAAYLGVVRGIVVRAPTISQGLVGGLKQMVGGNIEAYADACEMARKDAFDRMVRQAAALGADAVISMRYDATEFTNGVTEVLAYGTAVKRAGP